jgi:hypothetical protein
MSTEIVKQSPTIIRSFDDAERAATAMAASGFFQDSRSAAQAVVKILAGQELGFGPFASMTGISIIQGRPAIGANLIAAAIKRSGRYDYRILRLDETGCEIAFFDRGQEIGRAAFNEEDAKRAGLLDKDTWRKYRRNMYFARAISNGARWYCPDIFGGGPVYTPEELGAAVNEAGEVVDAPVVELPTEPAPVQPSEPPPAPAVPGDVTEVALAPTPAPTQNGAREWSFPVLQAILKAQLSDSTISAKKALALSNLSADCAPDQAVAWMRVYRAARDSGQGVAQAAESANAQERKEVAG